VARARAARGDAPSRLRSYVPAGGESDGGVCGVGRRSRARVRGTEGHFAFAYVDVISIPPADIVLISVSPFFSRVIFIEPMPGVSPDTS